MTSAAAAPELPALRSVTSSAAAVAMSVAAAAAAADTDISMDSRFLCSLCFYLSPNSSSTPDPSPTVIICPRCPSHSLNVPETLPFPPHRWPPPSPPPNSAHTSGSGVSYETSIDSESDVEDEDEDEDEDDDEFDEDYDSDYNFYQWTPALKSFVASLPIKILTPNLITPLCSICMDDLEINRDGSGIVNELPCGHCFHRDCISEWLGKTNTCPLCRYELPIDIDTSGEELPIDPNTEVVDQGEDERDMYVSVNSVATSEALETEEQERDWGRNVVAPRVRVTNFRAMLDVVRATFMAVDA